MEKALEQLHNRPVSPVELFGLMKPPREGIGFAHPLLVDANGSVVGAYAEVDGEVAALAYNGNEWQVVGPREDNFDLILHNDQTEEKVFREWSDTSQRVIPSETRSPQPEVQQQAPPGYFSKLCIRHRPLSTDDFTKLSSWPQFENSFAIHGSPDDGIISVIVSERNLTGRVPNAVVMYYNPILGTWRIVDSTPVSMFDDVAGQIYQDTHDQVSMHYQSVDRISAPRAD